MDQERYPVTLQFANNANVTLAQYRESYTRSLQVPEGFWGEQAGADMAFALWIE